MHLIRTDRSALLIGAVIMAMFTLEVVRTGLVVAGHGEGSVDAWVLRSLITGAVYALLFWLGHHLLRKRQSSSRNLYALIGAVASVPPFFLATGWTALAAASAAGRLSALLACPLVLGALLGFLYHRRAGYEADGDDPAALASTVVDPRAPTASGGLHVTQMAEYYEGPLVVRNSLGAKAIASLLGSSAFVLAVSLSEVAAPTSSPLGQFMAVNGPGKTILQGIIGAALPIMLFLSIAHSILRGRGKSTVRDYAIAGAVGPVIFSFLFALTGMSLFALVYLLQFLAPSLVAMLVYRNLAGLEPRPLPDDIIVTDRRTLVGADHVRRRVARVIDESR